MRPLSVRMHEQAASFDGVVVPARDAATVMLLRHGVQGPEVFLMRRRTTMAFAAGMHVFPGGGVDDCDREDDIPWLGPPPQRWSEAFGCAPENARALVVAAVRETFEETGILLAGPDKHTVVATPGDAAELRAQVEGHQLPFARLLRDRSLFLRADLLAPWAHWITPEFAPRRYDTRFFVGMLPVEQTLGALSGEADDAVWLPLSEVISSARSGTLEMMAPTLHVCRQVHEVPIEDLLTEAWHRHIITVAPRLVRIDGRFVYDNPPESEF